MFTFPQIVIGGEHARRLRRAARPPTAPAASELLAACRSRRSAALMAAGPQRERGAGVAAGSARTRTCRGRRRELADRLAARGHGSPARGWTRNRSWKLPRAPSTWRKSSIDAPFASIPAPAPPRSPRAARAHCAGVSAPAGRSGWIRAAEQRLVGVDVADAGDPPLVEDERLDRGGAPARLLAQVGRGELGRERLHAQPRAQIRRRAPARRAAVAPVPNRRGSTYTITVAVVELEAARACAAAPPPGRTAAPRSSAGASSRWRSPSSSQIRYFPRASEPLHPRAGSSSATARGGAGRVQRGSRISRARASAPSRCGRELAADRLDFGKLRHLRRILGTPTRTAWWRAASAGLANRRRARPSGGL